MKNIHIIFMPAILACLILAGCGNVKEQLGLNHQAPDEFAVMTRAPLEMPTSLALPPPRPGQPRPQEQTPETRAKQAIFGTSHIESTATAASTSESALLNKAGEQQADPNIRAVVEEEAIKDASSNRTVAQKLLGLSGKKPEANADVVDAKAEAQRIQDNIKNGKSVTDGETPSVVK